MTTRCSTTWCGFDVSKLKTLINSQNHSPCEWLIYFNNFIYFDGDRKNKFFFCVSCGVINFEKTWYRCDKTCDDPIENEYGKWIRNKWWWNDKINTFNSNWNRISQNSFFFKLPRMFIKFKQRKLHNIHNIMHDALSFW